MITFAHSERKFFFGRQFRSKCFLALWGLPGQNLNGLFLTLLIEDWSAAIDWNAVKSRRKAKDITMTFFMMRRFSDRNCSWLRSILLSRLFESTSSFLNLLSCDVL